MARKKSSPSVQLRKKPSSANKQKNVKFLEIKIGEKIRSQRKSNGYSIQKLAEISGVSPAGIYKIETNGMVPTITTLMKLATALERSMSYFVEEEETLPVVRHIRKSERDIIASGQEGRTEVVAEKLHKGRMEGFFRNLAPGARTRNQFISANGEHFIYCLKGDLSVRRGEDSFRLKEGDSLHYRSGEKVQFENRGRSEAKFLLVNAPFSTN